MFYVYAIKSQVKNYIYVGLTNDHVKRLERHNRKREKTTRPYAPFDMILLEEFSTRPEAREREKYLKSGFGKEYLKRL